MNKSVSNYISIFFLIILLGGAYAYRAELKTTAFQLKDIIFPTKPCVQPITYSLGDFDKQFGISKTDFLSVISQAADMWEIPMSKDLFTYSENGKVRINLTYDYRQEATQKLTEVNEVIQNKSSAYNAVKSEYDRLNIQYTQQKRSLEEMIREHEIKSKAYESKVSYWNGRGGAPKKEYDAMEAERNDLNEEVAEIKEIQAAFNALVAKLNSTATQLNKLAKDLNLNVRTYNTIGASAGEEFNEGEYISNSDGEFINIYQYENRTKLIRVLAHELGHAIGLDHIEDSEAIMYRLNEGTAHKATTEDITALKALCSTE